MIINEKIDSFYHKHKALSILLFLFIVLPFIFATWYLSIPLIGLWYLHKRTTLGKKGKTIGTVVLVLVAVTFMGGHSYSNKAPTFASLTPQTGMVIHERKVMIEGVVKPAGSKVSVNGENAEVKSNGAFSYMFFTPNETNIATVVATNVIGLVLAIYFTQVFRLETGALVVIFSYYASITRIFWEINRTYRNIESSISESAEFTQLFIDKPAIMDKERAKNLIISNSVICFNNVSFKYPTSKTEKEGKALLSNFNLKIESKQKVGLVGLSGGGKTTITKLILRFVDINSGSITIDDQDIRSITQKSLRQAISYVPQEPLLFHRSLFDNISYGMNNVTNEDVISSAKIARADEFIQKLPQKYNTLVGERGIKLSGGQRQRIAIARAILKNSPILVLDEATSSLDSESEKYIQEGLLELMKNKTALVIAHRLSTIKHLDRIIVLDDGKIVQDGTHAELITQQGIYAKLWSHQSGEFI